MTFGNPVEFDTSSFLWMIDKTATIATDLQLTLEQLYMMKSLAYKIAIVEDF